VSSSAVVTLYTIKIGAGSAVSLDDSCAASACSKFMGARAFTILGVFTCAILLAFQILEIIKFTQLITDREYPTCNKLLIVPPKGTIFGLYFLSGFLACLSFSLAVNAFTLSNVSNTYGAGLAFTILTWLISWALAVVSILREPPSSLVVKLPCISKFQSEDSSAAEKKTPTAIPSSASSSSSPSTAVPSSASSSSSPSTAVPSSASSSSSAADSASAKKFQQPSSSANKPSWTAKPLVSARPVQAAATSSTAETNAEWVELYDQEHKLPYWQSTKDPGVSTWERPEGMQAKKQQAKS
jgi:hypothetical protein